MGCRICSDLDWGRAVTIETDTARWRDMARHTDKLVAALWGREPDELLLKPEQQRDAWKALYDRRLAFLRRMGGMDV